MLPYWMNLDKIKEKAPDFSEALSLNRIEPDVYMAEKVRFELTELLHSAVFKTAALNHSATSPYSRDVPYSTDDFEFQSGSAIRSIPPMYGCSAAGIRMEPSSC